jgi:hypothetical protein
VPGWLRWTVLALLGLTVAAGISVAASKLVSQRIGLASEPLSAGRELAPPVRDERSNHRASRPTPPPVTTTTTTTAIAPPPSPTPPTTGAPYTGAPTTSTASPAPSGGDGSGEAEHEGGDD